MVQQVVAKFVDHYLPRKLIFDLSDSNNTMCSFPNIWSCLIHWSHTTLFFFIIHYFGLFYTAVKCSVVEKGLRVYGGASTFGWKKWTQCFNFLLVYIFILVVLVFSGSELWDKWKKTENVAFEWKELRWLSKITKVSVECLIWSWIFVAALPWPSQPWCGHAWSWRPCHDLSLILKRSWQGLIQICHDQGKITMASITA